MLTDIIENNNITWEYSYRMDYVLQGFWVFGSNFSGPLDLKD